MDSKIIEYVYFAIEELRKNNNIRSPTDEQRQEINEWFSYPLLENFARILKNSLQRKGLEVSDWELRLGLSITAAVMLRTCSKEELERRILKVKQEEQELLTLR